MPDLSEEATQKPVLTGRAAAPAQRVAMVAGWAGAVLGVCAGIVQLTYGSSIPDWTGSKREA
jgi:hypothetical protein